MKVAPGRKHKHLKDYSDGELLEILKKVEGIPSNEIGYYCVEILRRLLENKNEIFLPDPYLENK